MVTLGCACFYLPFPLEGSSAQGSVAAIRSAEVSLLSRGISYMYLDCIVLFYGKRERFFWE